MQHAPWTPVHLAKQVELSGHSSRASPGGVAACVRLPSRKLVISAALLRSPPPMFSHLFRSVCGLVEAGNNCCCSVWHRLSSVCDYLSPSILLLMLCCLRGGGYVDGTCSSAVNRAGRKGPHCWYPEKNRTENGERP